MKLAARWAVTKGVGAGWWSLSLDGRWNDGKADDRVNNREREKQAGPRQGTDRVTRERRARAARLAGLDEVPVLVRNVPDEAAAVMALIENIQRENLDPLEEARGLQRLTDDFGQPIFGRK